MVGLAIKLRVKFGAWKQRRRDRAWLKTKPSMAEIMAERNRRQTEWMRHEAAQLGEGLAKWRD